MFEESSGIPLIAAGPDIPNGHVCNTPVSLIDVHPTALDAVGIGGDEAERGLPGQSLFDIARNDDEGERVVLSEYHAVGSCSGAFMVRRGQYKLVHYVGLESQLFDLERDPEETEDVSNIPGYAKILAGLEACLLEIVDPDEVDARAKKDQAILLEKHGGRSAVISKGTFGPTPAPGEKIEYTAARQ